MYTILRVKRKMESTVTNQSSPTVPKKKTFCEFVVDSTLQ